MVNEKRGININLMLSLTREVTLRVNDEPLPVKTVPDELIC